MGLPMSITDFVQNYEASAINAKSPRSLISAIHSAFGVGLMLGALASNIFISAGISLQLGFFITSVIVFLPSAWAATVFPKDESTSVPATVSSDSATKFSPWREVRTLKIAFIGLTFIVAEVSAATWVPIALVQSGVSASDAAVALSIFWLVVTIARATGGLLVDRVGRANTLLIASLTTATGTAIFGLSPLINLPYLGMLPWAAGMALGFPMAVNAMADDPARAAKRINMMITVVYISGLIVGPLLGGVGQQVGIFLAFSLPTAFLVIGAALSKNARQLQS
jgi:fucose permease